MSCKEKAAGAATKEESPPQVFLCGVDGETTPDLKVTTVNAENIKSELYPEYFAGLNELIFRHFQNFYNQYASDDTVVADTNDTLRKYYEIHYEVLMPNQRTHVHNAARPAVTVRCKVRIEVFRTGAYGASVVHVGGLLGTGLERDMVYV